jgi:hypothetical protein
MAVAESLFSCFSHISSVYSQQWCAGQSLECCVSPDLSPRHKFVHCRATLCVCKRYLNGICTPHKVWCIAVMPASVHHYLNGCWTNLQNLVQCSHWRLFESSGALYKHCGFCIYCRTCFISLFTPMCNLGEMVTSWHSEGCSPRIPFLRYFCQSCFQLAWARIDIVCSSAQENSYSNRK